MSTEEKHSSILGSAWASYDQSMWVLQLWRYTSYEGCSSVLGRNMSNSAGKEHVKQSRCVNLQLHTSWGMSFSAGKKRKMSKTSKDNLCELWTTNMCKPYNCDYTPHEGCSSVWGRKGRHLKINLCELRQHTSWGMFLSVGKKRKTSKDQPVWTATTHLMRDVLQCREAREVDVKQRSWQQAFVDHVRLQAEMKLGDVTDSENK